MAQKFDMGRDIPGEWWTVFHSKELDELIAEALQANPNLQAAQAALWQAKENLYAQTGKLLPKVDANSSAERQQFSPAAFGQAGPPDLFNLYQATVNVSYAPDVFGGQRRQIEATAALAEYQRFELEATYLTLTANVVTAVVQEASLRGQIDATHDIIKIESDQLGVVNNQFQGGAAARTDVLTQQSELATAQATLPPLLKQLEQQHHVLLALIGRFPNEVLRDRLTLASLRLPTDLPLTLPSQLVEQRPDIRAAEAQLHQASAQIGVAIANRLPQFNLTGAYGSAALEHRDPVYARHPDMERRRERHPADFPRLHAAASAARRRSRLYHGGGAISQHGAAELFRTSPMRCAHCNLMPLRSGHNAPRLRAASGTLNLARGQYRLGADHLCDLAECATQLSAEPPCRGSSAGGALCRYRRFVPSARRRLVEPHRCDAQSAEPRRRGRCGRH